MVSTTPPGGVVYLLASDRSDSLRFFSTATAASRAGSASARSRSADDLISAHCAALVEAIASSFSTTSWVALASFLSLAMTIIISSTSALVFVRTGFISSICFLSSSTTTSVVLSLSRPTTNRRLAVPTSSRFRPSRILNVESTSRYEVGVT